jgi:hypothetical protein
MAEQTLTLSNIPSIFNAPIAWLAWFILGLSWTFSLPIRDYVSDPSVPNAGHCYILTSLVTNYKTLARQVDPPWVGVHNVTYNDFEDNANADTMTLLEMFGPYSDSGFLLVIISSIHSFH